MFSCEASSEAATGGDGANSLMLSFNGYWDGDDGDDDGDTALRPLAHLQSAKHPK